MEIITKIAQQLGCSPEEAREMLWHLVAGAPGKQNAVDTKVDIPGSVDFIDPDAF